MVGCLPWQVLLALCNVLGEAKSRPFSGASERCFIHVGSRLIFKHKTRLERFARDKHSSLLQKSVKCGRKKFYDIDTCSWTEWNKCENGPTKNSNRKLILLPGNTNQEGLNTHDFLIKVACFVIELIMLAISKETSLYRLVQGGQLYRTFPFSKGSLLLH